MSALLTVRDGYSIIISVSYIKGPDYSDTSDDEAELFLGMVSDLNNQIRALQGSEAKSVPGGVLAAAGGGQVVVGRRLVVQEQLRQ